MMMWIEPFIDNATQCWGCSVFDALFQIVSKAGAVLYGYMAFLSVILLAVFVAFYVLYSVWTNLRNDAEDPTYMKYFKPVLINSIVVLGLLSAGVMFPRLITRVTMEPVADITLVYAQAMLNKTPEAVSMQVPYEAQDMPADGFYRPQLRDTIIQLIQTSTTQFQAMMNMGLYIMDGAFNWRAFTGIGALVKHVIMFFMGLALTWGFFKLFVKFCFYFVDVIINMSMFAFFFPLGLVMFVFRESQSAPWVQQLGGAIAPKMLKDVINSIITLATVTITYVVIMVMLARFFADDAIGGAALAEAILNGDIYRGDISSDNLAAMTLSSMIVLVYVVQFLAGQIDEISNMITKTFGVEPPKKAPVGDAIGEDVLKIGENVGKWTATTAVNVTKSVLGVEDKK